MARYARWRPREGAFMPGRPLRARLARVRVYVGSDHAGFELKSVLVNWLTSAGHEVTDCGPASYHADDDYPPYVMRAAAATAADPASLGIVIGGAGARRPAAAPHNGAEPDSG